MGENVFCFNELLCDIRIWEKSCSKEKIIELPLFSLCSYSRGHNYVKQIQSLESLNDNYTVQRVREEVYFIAILRNYSWITAVNSCLVWLIDGCDDHVRLL